jgi:phage baseplate assembly protein W
MAGMNARTGKPLAGWPHVVQSLGVIFSTRIGERVMRRWFGSAVPALLGQNLTTQTFLKFFSAIYAAVELYEPRFRITKVTPVFVERTGRAGLRIEGEYRPRGHLGDFTVAGAGTLLLASNGEVTS